MEENNNKVVDNTKNEQTNFKDLPIKEQIQSLERTLQIISQKIYQERNAEILSGSIEISDISYNVTSDNEVIYNVTMKNINTGEEIHELYNNKLEKINIDKEKIQAMKIMGYNTSIAEKQLTEMDNIQNNPDKVSLSELKEHDKEIDELSNSLGISRENIAQVTVIDSNQELKIKADELKGLQYGVMSGEERVSVHYNMRDVIGGNFVSYQIIKATNGSYELFGIDENGYAKEIGNDKVERITSNESVKLIQENGEIKDARILVAFRIKSQGDIDRDQVIGLCDDGTSEQASFYGRGAITNDDIVGEKVASKTYSENRVKTEHLMDTLETDNQEFNTTDEYIEDAAKKYDIDEDELREEVIRSTEDYATITREEIEGIADFMAREPSREPRGPGDPR